MDNGTAAPFQKLTVHALDIARVVTVRGLAYTPRKPIGPRLNVELISLNGQVLGDT